VPHVLLSVNNLSYRHGSPVSEFQEILFLNIISSVIVGETRNSLWNATMVRRLNTVEQRKRPNPPESPALLIGHGAWLQEV
jgi:hypothetical protein